MSKVLVAVNVLDTVSSQVYGSHCQEWFRMGRNNTDDQFILFHPNRLSIDNARNQAAIYAQMYECDYIYFVDDDMILTPNTYSSLKACNADIAQALTYIRSYPFNMMAFRNSENHKLDYFNNWQDFVDYQGNVECEAVGFACVLIKTSLFKKIQPPYFVTGVGVTEDVYFCLKLRQSIEANYLRIVVDTKVPTSHLLHPEGLNVFNREKLLAHYAEENKHVNGKDRGEEYLDMAKGQFQRSKTGAR